MRSPARWSAAAWVRDALAPVAALVLVACGSAPPVARLVDGHPITSRFIDVDAYDAYLRGALAEASGHPDEAIAAFEDAASDDPSDPDIWTRIGEIACAHDRAGNAADRAFERAIRVDPKYGAAYLARATCEARRGHADAAQADASRAEELDSSVPSLVLAEEYDASPAARARLVTATEARGASVEAWRALAHWASAKGDLVLVARAYEGALAVSPSVRLEAAVAAAKIAAGGDAHMDDARALAGRAADRMDDPANGRRDPLPPRAAQLAVDDAILRGDAKVIARRLVETRTTLDEAIARAATLRKSEAMRPLVEQRRQAEAAGAKTP